MVETRRRTMARGVPADRTEDFDRHRALLFSIAYRMLGGVADAEDVVQDAFLRWQKDAGTEVRSPNAYLSAVVTRLSIDHLRREKARRERYVGPWLPEPLVGETASDAAERAVLDESLSMAFLVLLESLTPVERAVFLLREVFDYEYAEISRRGGKCEAKCRQISRRARRSVAARRPRFDPSPEAEERLLRSFLGACMSGDMDALIPLLSDDVTLWSDGGGRVVAARNAIHGPDRVARFLLGILREAPPGLVLRWLPVNGRPGLVGYFADGRSQGVVTLDVADGSIRAVRIVVNPEKRENVPPLPSSLGVE